MLIASISLTEFGRRLRELGATDAEVEETLAGYELLFMEIVPVDTIVAKAAFGIGGHPPRRLPLVDAIIAAVAQVKGATLVHRDEHMRSIPLSFVDQQDLAQTTS